MIREYRFATLSAETQYGPSVNVPMPILSVIMIVKNEARCLGACLGSVRAVADEIVIADTGSTDATIDIAHSFGAQVFSIPWCDDFAKARNRSIAAASGDWLLHLDADEALDPDGARRIRELVDNDGFNADAVELTLANYCDDPRAWRWVAAEPGDPFTRGHAGYIPVGLLRLFRNRMGFEYREPVHENISESVAERGGRVRKEDIVIHHYGYDPDDPHNSEKGRRYLTIARTKCMQRPHDPKAWHDLAEQALACGLPVEAEDACRKAIEIEARYLPAVMSLANILLNRGGLAEAKPLLESLAVQDDAPEHAFIALAAIDCRDGRPESARTRLEYVLEHKPCSILARLYLARALDQDGEPARASQELEVARNLAPALPEPRDRVRAHQLRTQGERLLEDGSSEEALACLVEALRLDSEDPLIHNNLGVVLHAMGLSGKARESFERALRLARDLPQAVKNLAMMAAKLP